MARKDLLSEAIADAKAVKETAMANAKLALEEAFTPKLQSMISAKLAEEADDEEVDETYEGEETEESYHEEEEVSDEEEMTEEEDEMEMDLDSDDSEEEEMEMDSEEEVSEEEDMDADEDDLDLESIIAELEAEMDEEEDMDSEEEDMEVSEEEDMEVSEEEEEIDLDEVIRTLKEMEHDEEEEAMTEAEEDMDEEEDSTEELEEAYRTIESLRGTINEVNLLNAKLLYTNKLFRTFDLNEGQKVKVLENFDRTSSVREVKLVFSTLAENLNVAKKTKVVVKEGYASKATKSSAPKKIISEGNEMAARWKKLAGLK